MASNLGSANDAPVAVAGSYDPKCECAAAVEHGEWRSPPRPTTERATVTTSESRNGHTTGAPLSKKKPAVSSGLRSGPNWASLEPAGAPERVTEPS